MNEQAPDFRQQQERQVILGRRVFTNRVTTWPKLFVNLRSSCGTELTAQYPLHVVCAWIGNSPTVARDHYMQVTEDHFRQAAENKRGGKGFAKRRRMRRTFFFPDGAE